MLDTTVQQSCCSILLTLHNNNCSWFILVLELQQLLIGNSDAIPSVVSTMASFLSLLKQIERRGRGASEKNPHDAPVKCPSTVAPVGAVCLGLAHGSARLTSVRLQVLPYCGWRWTGHCVLKCSHFEFQIVAQKYCLKSLSSFF